MKRILLFVALLALFSTLTAAGSFRAQSSSIPRGSLAPTPAPVSAGASIAAVVGLVSAPVNSVFALRGGGTTDFWHYSIPKNEWTVLPQTPAPVGDGAAIVEVHSWDFCKPGQYYIAALRGGGTSDFWEFN
ncbi:MAG TPA: hypothetical protein VFV34_10805, partial [Blastocatellia bacterium]|nr:hypothetical protein [Blastocatellia bacterium]